MKYFLPNFIVLIVATQILCGAASEETSAAGGRLLPASRTVIPGHPLRPGTKPLKAHIPITLRVDADEFYRAYTAIDNSDNNPYQRFFGILFMNYFNGTMGSYPADLTKAILKQQTREYGFYVKFSGPIELKASTNLGEREPTWMKSKNAAHKAFKARLMESFSSMPANPYYQFVIAALSLRDEPKKAEHDLEVNAAKLVDFSIRGLGNQQTSTALDLYQKEYATIANSQALGYLRQYHQKMYLHRNHTHFVRFTFYVPKVLRALEWSTYKLALFDEFNGLIATNLQSKRKYHQKLFPDLKSTLWRAVAGAMTGLISSVRPTMTDVTSLVATGYAWISNSSGLITNTTSNSTLYNETEAFSHKQQFTTPFDSQRAAFMAMAATGGALITILGESVYNYLSCPPSFRLKDEDYATEINLLSAYCVEQIVQRYGNAWDRARSVLIAERVTDVILHDSIGFRKYIHNKIRWKKHPLSFAEIFRSYGKLPTTIFEDYRGLTDLFTI